MAVTGLGDSCSASVSPASLRDASGRRLRFGRGSALARLGVATAGLLIAGTGAASLYGCGGDPNDDPEQVLRTYIQATLTAQDTAAAVAVTCQYPRLSEMETWRDDLNDRRQRHSLPPLTAEIMSYRGAESRNAVTATADVAVTLATHGRPQERITRSFTFTLTSEDGWKVCHAADD